MAATHAPASDNDSDTDDVPHPPETDDAVTDNSSSKYERPVDRATARSDAPPTHDTVSRYLAALTERLDNKRGAGAKQWFTDAQAARRPDGTYWIVAKLHTIGPERQITGVAPGVVVAAETGRQAESTQWVPLAKFDPVSGRAFDPFNGEAHALVRWTTSIWC